MQKETNKKYIILENETLEHYGRTLYRIQAVKDFSDVKAGDKGGWVSGYHNLSQEGDCWVYDESKVFDEAVVLDNAKVCDNAKVYGNAEIYDEATVSDNAKVYGDSEINEEYEIYGNMQINYWYVNKD